MSLHPERQYVFEEHWRVVLALCPQAGAECARGTEPLCWLHAESLSKAYHLVCSNTVAGLKVGIKHLSQHVEALQNRLGEFGEAKEASAK